MRKIRVFLATGLAALSISVAISAATPSSAQAFAHSATACNYLRYHHPGAKESAASFFDGYFGSFGWNWAAYNGDGWLVNQYYQDPNGTSAGCTGTWWANDNSGGNGWKPPLGCQFEAHVSQADIVDFSKWDNCHN